MSGFRTPGIRPLPLYGPLLAAIITHGGQGHAPYTVSEIARQHGVRPRAISDLFYNRELSDEKCPIIGGRRLIPPEYVSVIVTALRKHGLIPDPDTGPTPAQADGQDGDALCPENPDPASNRPLGECE